MRGPAAIAALSLGLLASACGEKKENLEVPETVPGLETGSIEPGPSILRVEGGAAKDLARVSASAAVAPTFVVDPAAWTVNCKYGQTDLVSCSVATGLCRGSVLITPTKVPAGESADDYSPKADASRVRCRTKR